MNDYDQGTECILVADDEPTVRTLLRRTLEKGGYRVLVASGGEEAVELAAKMLPSVALIDAVMPGLDGFGVCGAIKSHELTSDIQVLMVTALSDVSDIERGFKAGALDYIRKPFNPNELLVRIRNACLLARSQREQKQWREQVTRELYLAERLQRRLLDNAPIMTGKYALSSAYVPSGGISGDVFDQFKLDDGRIIFYMADVCGHGVAASLVSSLIKVMASEIVKARMFGAVCEIANDLDLRFRELLGGYSTYATVFIGEYDPEAKRLVGLSCGHPSPIVVRSDGASEMPFSTRGGMPIGFAIDDQQRYSREDQVEVSLAEGEKDDCHQSSPRDPSSTSRPRPPVERSAGAEQPRARPHRPHPSAPTTSVAVELRQRGIDHSSGVPGGGRVEVQQALSTLSPSNEARHARQSGRIFACTVDAERDQEIGIEPPLDLLLPGRLVRGVHADPCVNRLAGAVYQRGDGQSAGTPEGVLPLKRNVVEFHDGVTMFLDAVVAAIAQLAAFG